MKFLERILLTLSREPMTDDYNVEDLEQSLEDSLSLLEHEYLNFKNIINNNRILDFGCGSGFQSVALATKYDCSVVGLDSNKKTLQRAIELASQHNISEDKLIFTDNISNDMKGKFDIVISQNSFEHFDDPKMILGLMKELVSETGVILITFGPPWFAPYGSHMHFFCKIPWVNVFFPEKTVMAVRNRFRDDGATRYEQVESGLNKMTVKKFNQIINSSNLKIDYKKYRCIKGLDFLSHIPFLREFFINHVTVKLIKAM